MHPLRSALITLVFYAVLIYSHTLDHAKNQSMQSAATPAPVTLSPAEKPEKRGDYGSLLKNIKAGKGAFDFGVGLRLRYEYFTNMSLKTYATATDDDMLLDQERLSIGFRSGFGLRLFTEIYGGHLWLNEFLPRDFSPSCAYHNALDIKELYAEMNNIAGTGIGWRIGRQSFSYGDEHVLGPGLWNNSVKYTWDGALLRIDTKFISASLLYGRRVITEPFKFDKNHYDFHLAGVYASAGSLPVKLDLFVIGKINPNDTVAGEMDTGNVLLCSFGLYSAGGAAGWRYNATLAGQTGTYGGSDAAAGGLCLLNTYTFPVKCKPFIKAGYTFASGDKDPGDGKIGTFDGIFGAAAKYYGKMNLFYWKNLHDLEAGAGIGFFNKIVLSLDYHYFLLASDTDAWYRTNGAPWKIGKKTCISKTGEFGAELGHEVDLIINASPLPHFKLLAGFCRFFAKDFIAALAPGEETASNWVFVQVEYAL